MVEMCKEILSKFHLFYRSSIYFIEVPFIGMDNDEVKIAASNFDEFIDYLFYSIDPNQG